nr:ribonuclease H-like domain-containing protein [Tanacetum cinerariifolium]
MILNTLGNLGKFEAKGDDGYFIRYSMSSKAFRVFNKRTRRVEENLHIQFLENKGIKQGAGPNWLFDIDSLDKSMNYVPVDASTNSTNLSGTKDAANQEVKKDESSLRYIVLPNWAHDALLESTSSTKEAANQEVKKNESSQRYILLPNWAHDALLEYTSSKPYEQTPLVKQDLFQKELLIKKKHHPWTTFN